MRNKKSWEEGFKGRQKGDESGGKNMIGRVNLQGSIYRGGYREVEGEGNEGEGQGGRIHERVKGGDAGEKAESGTT